MWRLVLDERTKMPLHVLHEHYRMEDLEDYHAWLDALDVLQKEKDRRAEAKRKAEERKNR